MKAVTVDHPAPCSVNDRSGYFQFRFPWMTRPARSNHLQIQTRQLESRRKCGICYISLVAETTSPQLKCQNCHVWYVDVWSSNFTWGGKPPPGEDALVVVPEGQLLLLDESTPVLAMLLIKGSVLSYSI